MENTTPTTATEAKPSWLQKLSTEFDSLRSKVASLFGHHNMIVQQNADMRAKDLGTAGAAKLNADHAATSWKAMNSVEEQLKKVADHIVIGDNIAVEPAAVDTAPAASNVSPAKAPTMRCKMYVTGIEVFRESGSDPNSRIISEEIHMSCVGGDKVQKGYPEDGVDEDNTFSRWSPSGSFSVYCQNPELFGKLKQGDKFYLDFTQAGSMNFIAKPFSAPKSAPAVPPDSQPDPAQKVEPVNTAAPQTSDPIPQQQPSSAGQQVNGNTAAAHQTQAAN